MTLEQKKVSLSIETDWLTFEYVDRLSKELENIQNTIKNIEQLTKSRFEELREWYLLDPTEWLEDIESEIETLKKKSKERFNKLKVEQEGLAERQLDEFSKMANAILAEVRENRKVFLKEIDRVEIQVNDTIVESLKSDMYRPLEQQIRSMEDKITSQEQEIQLQSKKIDNLTKLVHSLHEQNDIQHTQLLHSLKELKTQREQPNHVQEEVR
ncbi:hypothetical protein SAMN05880501_105178 [Ureibacillus xyleni]|uniref:Uncharacterized protein n=1 Tax=Ureibacillus xyleni TaxID=614648 RepID=A0A285SS43_9BACL|nr:hypothetical protein [Ureibacillus xyleni]SOC09094.1 hypothetical protein SAMN05880501_105178 [Ureibacillus xyleni]